MQATELDHSDALRAFRERFHLPRTNGREQAYFCGNSLGLMPRSARDQVEEVLQQWSAEGVEAHFKGHSQWMPYHELVRDDLAAVVGALPLEVVAMNSLTANLHLMMASFYRPAGSRRRILIEARAFPSDRHAVASQIRWHGGDPATDLIELAPEPGQDLLTSEAIEAALATQGEQIALVLLPGIQYVTGQAFDIARVTAAAHAQGCQVGFDLAHAVGNLPLQLHEQGPDFAVWCSYKYLNSGPGGVAGCFVHERHARADLPRLAGWWGHDAASRFRMGPEFVPTPGAEGWQLSNPPILALAPLRASLPLFLQAGMAELRQKSVALTAYLERLLLNRLGDALSIVTPADPTQRGCQLSIRLRQGRELGQQLYRDLLAQGIVCDWREPDILRASPVPLYNRFEDCDRLVEAVELFLRQHGTH
ncbi:MAG: kynureninase [Xanthomonadales bacterium]|nr:kynureninase [Xanthomonadales bacterium]